MKKLIFLLFILSPQLAHANLWFHKNPHLRNRGIVDFNDNTKMNQNARIREVIQSDDYQTPPADFIEQHLQLISWNPNKTEKKFLNKIKVGETTQLEILKLFSGPNIIQRQYPEDREMWVYYWLWSYDLKYPAEETMIKMSNPGRRILRGRNPVELEVMFGKNDVVEDFKLKLIKRGPEY